MSSDIDGSECYATPCVGCLSIGRRLSQIYDPEQKAYYTQLIDTTCLLSARLVLCWECESFIVNGVRFKQRVMAAKVMQHNALSYTLSKLQRSHVKCISIPEVEPNEEPEPLVEVKVEPHPGAGIVVAFDVGVKMETVPDDVKGEDDADDCFFDDPPVLDDDEKANTASRTKPQRERAISTDSDEIPLKLISKKQNDGPARKWRKVKSGVITNDRILKRMQLLKVDPKHVQKVLLSWEEVLAERRSAESSATFQRKTYKCMDCIIGFNHKIKLDNHMKKHDKNIGPSTCSLCNIHFARPTSLNAHRRRHLVRWRCILCGHMRSTLAVTADHLARMHGCTQAVHECVHCGHKARSLNKLRVHMLNHSERQRCDICGKTFRDKTSLKTHLFIHRGEKEYSCTTCSKKFLFKKAMEIHMITHEASQALYCVECDTNFKNKMSYDQHMKYNLKHIDPALLKYSCDLCDRKFVASSRLEEHRQAVHLKITPVKCTYEGCTFECSSKPVLRAHIRVIHTDRGKQRNHVCHACGKCYKTKKTLEDHMRTHTGERPFKCKLCESNFGYEAALYNHNKLVHLKVKRNKTKNADAWN